MHCLRGEFSPHRVIWQNVATEKTTGQNQTSDNVLLSIKDFHDWLLKVMMTLLNMTHPDFKKKIKRKEKKLRYESLVTFRN